MHWHWPFTVWACTRSFKFKWGNIAVLLRMPCRRYSLFWSGPGLLSLSSLTAPSYCIIRSPLLPLSGGWQGRRVKWQMDEVMCLAELTHGLRQDTQTGDQWQKNCPLRGEPTSRLASAHCVSMCLWYMQCVWMQRHPVRSLYKCTTGRFMVNFEQKTIKRSFDSVCLSGYICL